MISRIRTYVLMALVFGSSVAVGQSFPPFDLAAYRQFLATHQNLSPEQLLALRPAGVFANSAPTSFSVALFSDSIQIKYALTAPERALIEANGFMVTERLRRPSFGAAFSEIYHADLPVFISTDAILHAIHMSYDAMLKDVEGAVLIPRLDTLLARLHGQLPMLATRYASAPEMKQSLIDVDLYFTVARKLLGSTATPVYAESEGSVNTMMALIKGEMPRQYPLFSSTPRLVDFSQFTVRGHYTQTDALKKYFQAMIWLGRTEMYLLAPVNAIPSPTNEDIQRQTIDAVLVAEAAQGADAYGRLEEIDGVLRFFVGESDNVTLPNVRTLMQTTSTDNAAMLLDTTRLRVFQDTLKRQSFAFQRILSQIILSDPANPDDIKPASSFLLMGQRFVIDSYITGSVVYDKIKFDNRKIWRPLPSTLDVLYSLGNDAAAQLLAPELSRYQYASNLASLRYLVDGYDPGFWQGTLYNNWLNSIRALNPPADRRAFPRFMQTAAWWQEKMTTQLASWSQLRHDNLLYAKQSYTGGVICSYPESYVEPIPEFFQAVKVFGSAAAEKFRSGVLAVYGIDSYWERLSATADTLGAIAQKELTMTAFTENEKGFLHRMLLTQPMCGQQYDGWYYRLFYTRDEGFQKEDRVVADVHTCPTDELGAMVGWVLHAGTGPVDLAVVSTELPDRRLVSFIGPVMSYYEHVSTNFKRLTDEEWKTAYQIAPSFRPDFVNIYLADSMGNARAAGPSLLTGVSDDRNNQPIPLTAQLGQNYPNPFNGSTIITFTIPQALSASQVEVTIYDVQGRVVKQLLKQQMPAGNFALRWDGTTSQGFSAASGVYFYHLIVGSQRQIGKMSFIK
jgi:hypothetical protein